MMIPTNPFLVSGYQSPEYFCDRAAETAAIGDALHNGRNITLIAPRRMGKTGLVRHVFHKLKEEHTDIITLYVDIYSTQSLTEFVRLFANTVLGALDTAPQKALNRISKFIRSCRPTLTFDEITGMPTDSVDYSSRTDETTLREIFDYLGSSEKRCYIAIDEFQQIAEYPEKGVEALLRSYIQFLPNVNFIFAGSKQHVMQEMFTSSQRPFYQSTQLLTLGAIGCSEYRAFATTHFAHSGKHLPSDVFDLIYNKFAGHTWYIQSILNRLYGYQCDVDAAMVEYAISQIVSEMSYSYLDLMKAYSVSSQRLLRAIATEGIVKELLSGEFISKYSLRAASSVSGVAKKLLANEMIYDTGEGYIIYDRFFAEWLKAL